MISRKILFQTFVLIILTGCRSATETSITDVSKQQAIDAALAVVSSSRPEVSGPQIEPSNIRAEQMTLGEAVKKMSKDRQPASGYDPNMIVWFITMDGLWLNEMDAPGVVITPAPYHHYAIIIDAKTGSEIESFLTP
jgi:hypothetical protein